MGPLIVDYEAAMPTGRGGEMADDLKGMKVAILATDGVERFELQPPRGALYGAGASGDLLSVHSGEIQARLSDLIPAGTFPVDHLVTDVSVEDYDALLLPGGTVNPDGLRIDPDAVGFVKAFVATGKPLAAICHGPWTLIETDSVRGHRFTCGPSLWTDLPAFCPAIVAQFAKASVPG
jgi:protease I